MADTPIELARAAADHMASRGIDNARLEAELLLAAVLGLSRLELYLQHDRPLTAEEKEAFRAVVRRRLRREPLQYIVGTAQFRELTLAVDPRVLIPRPETEALVAEVLRWAASRRMATASDPAPRDTAARDATVHGAAGPGAAGRDAAVGDAAEGNPPVGDGPPALIAVDIGTGSGAIALSLAKEGPFARIVATDASADALDVARGNAERGGLADRVEFRHGSLWEALGPDERFDVVVSNPPYIAEADRDTLAPEVAAWEPAAALFAGGDGLVVVNAIVDGAADRLREGGLLALEVGADQAAAVVERVERRGGYTAPRVVRDLAGRERVVLAERMSLA